MGKKEWGMDLLEKDWFPNSVAAKSKADVAKTIYSVRPVAKQRLIA